MNTTYANGDRIAVVNRSRENNKQFYVHETFECEVLASNELGHYVETENEYDGRKRFFIDKDTPTILVNHLPPMAVNIIEKPVEKHWWNR